MSLDKNQLIKLLQTTIELIQADRIRVNDIQGLTTSEILDLAERMSADAADKAGELARPTE